MVRRPLIRRFLAAVLSAGVFLIGAVPSWAIPMTDNGDRMPGMTMAMTADASGHCSAMMDMAHKSKSDKAPGGHCALCYAVCAASAANSGTLQDFSAFAGSRETGSRLLGLEARPDAVVHPPALPPPILAA